MIDYVIITFFVRKIIFCLGFLDMNHFPDLVIHNNEKLSLAVALIVDSSFNCALVYDKYISSV